MPCKDPAKTVRMHTHMLVCDFVGHMDAVLYFLVLLVLDAVLYFM